ncbi:conserved hypothetical protein [Neospora caninum Liverpool]|uniref:Uncharacterized protein n=1 Tax=Neospora caninum (strain Liverpool) TaxID=572307 RepID=F0VQQ9_NEOCL|nr:conserved hypothetical protein [Neospora caninum Liverpool]CBZ56056.1 conserved hypothetical protein [Neospora caninum Liverpool]|eukprot:XP_003886082.1 conserved hypothetical protein [Neospora caninum Liverpool]
MSGPSVGRSADSTEGAASQEPSLSSPQVHLPFSPTPVRSHSVPLPNQQEFSLRPTGPVTGVASSGVDAGSSVQQLWRFQELQRQRQMQFQQLAGTSSGVPTDACFFSEKEAPRAPSETQFLSSTYRSVAGGSTTQVSSQLPSSSQAFPGGPSGPSIPAVSVSAPEHLGASNVHSPVLSHQPCSPLSLSSVSSAEDETSCGTASGAKSAFLSTPVPAVDVACEGSSSSQGFTASSAAVSAPSQPSNFLGQSTGGGVQGFGSGGAGASVAFLAASGSSAFSHTPRTSQRGVAPQQTQPAFQSQPTAAGSQLVPSQQLAVQQLLERVRLHGCSVPGLEKILMGTGEPGTVAATEPFGRPAFVSAGSAADTAALPSSAQKIGNVAYPLVSGRDASGRQKDTAASLFGVTLGADLHTNVFVKLQEQQHRATGKEGAGSIFGPRLLAPGAQMPNQALRTASSACPISAAVDTDVDRIQAHQNLRRGADPVQRLSRTLSAPGKSPRGRTAARDGNQGGAARFLQPPVVVASRVAEQGQSKFLQKSRNVGGRIKEGGSSRRGVTAHTSAPEEVCGAVPGACKPLQSSGRIPFPSGVTTREVPGRLPSSLEGLKQLQHSVNQEILLRQQERVRQEASSSKVVNSEKIPVVDGKLRDFMVWPPGMAGALTSRRSVTLFGKTLSPSFLPRGVEPMSVRRLLSGGLTPGQPQGGSQDCRADTSASVMPGEGTQKESRARTKSVGSFEKGVSGKTRGLLRDTQKACEDADGVASRGSGQDSSPAQPPWHAFLESLTVSGFLAYWYARQHVAAGLYRQLQQMEAVEKRLEEHVSGGCALHSNLFFFSLFPETFSNTHFQRNLRYFPQYTIAHDLAAAADLRPLSQYGDTSVSVAAAATKDRTRLQAHMEHSEQTHGQDSQGIHTFGPAQGMATTSESEMAGGRTPVNGSGAAQLKGGAEQPGRRGSQAIGGGSEMEQANAATSFSRGISEHPSSLKVKAAFGRDTGVWVAEARYLPTTPSWGGVQLSEDLEQVEQLIQAAQSLLQGAGEVQEHQLENGKRSGRLEREEDVPILVASLPRSFEAMQQDQQPEQLASLAAKKLLPLHAWKGQDFRSFKSVVPFAARALFAISIGRLEHLIASLQQGVASSIASLELLRNSLVLLQQVEESYAPPIYAIPQHVLCCIFNRGGQGTDLTSKRRQPAAGCNKGDAGDGSGAGESGQLGTNPLAPNGLKKELSQQSSPSPPETDAQASRCDGAWRNIEVKAKESLQLAPEFGSGSETGAPDKLGVSGTIGDKEEASKEEQDRGQDEGGGTCTQVIVPTWERGLRLGPPISARDFEAYADAFEDYLPLFAADPLGSGFDLMTHEEEDETQETALRRRVAKVTTVLNMFQQASSI